VDERAEFDVVDVAVVVEVTLLRVDRVEVAGAELFAVRGSLVDVSRFDMFTREPVYYAILLLLLLLLL
jgi:hypothetical protein